MSSTWLRIGGFPATTIGAHTPPLIGTVADGGCELASFRFDLSARSQHGLLRERMLVEVMSGPVPVWMGLLNEPDRTTWECHASGLSASLRGFLALDGGGTPTRNLSTAVSRAQSLGWLGTNPTPVSGTAAGDSTGNPVTVGTLLDDYAAQIGSRWGVNGRGELFMRPDPTAPMWLASPDAAAFGSTTENTPRRLAGRFFDGTNYVTAYAGSGQPEESVDLTDRGALTTVAAQAVLTGMLQRAGFRGWTNAVELHRDQITTSGGVPANLLQVRAGQMIRTHGLAYGIVSGTPWLDVVIGKTSHVVGTDTITIEPVNTAPRTFVAVQAAS